jgi:dTDP-glucose 4,6-dehydratase
VIARPFNTYGPRQSARAVIPTVITQIANGAKKLKLGAITPTRDFSYVQDTVDAFTATLRSDKGLGEVVNFGSNFEISIADVAALIAEKMNVKIDVASDTERMRPVNSEVERLWADNSKAEELFGWSPKYAGRDGLARGLQETINWFMQPENLKHFKSDIFNI